MTQFIVTAQTLRHMMMCERRVWLDQHGNHNLRDELTQEPSITGNKHEQRATEAMFGSAQAVPTASWEDMVYTTRRLMEQGASAIRGGAFEVALAVPESIIVRCRIDWLRRTAQPSRLGKWTYEPVEIKLRRDCNEADRLQLDLYLCILQAIQETETSGWFWMGRDTDNSPLAIIEHFFRRDHLSAALLRAGAIWSDESAPAIFLAPHCASCHWQTSCKQTAHLERGVASLPGLSRYTWEHMHRDGVHTLDQILTLSPKELERFKGLGKAKAQELYAYAQAFGYGKPVQRSAVPEIARQPGIMLDLETCMDGNIGTPWCFGWQVNGIQFEAAIVDAYYDSGRLVLPNRFEAKIVSDSDEGWRLFAQVAQAFPGPIYHWGSFEKAVLRATAPTEVVEALEDRLHDLNKTFKQSFVFPVRGTSIKTIAPYLGFHWPDGTNAFSAWADYQSWLFGSNRHALARACDYNRADVEAMALVWQWMLENDGQLSDKL